ncbi:MAG TPA: glycosyl hydrolase [Blastocatellia bacterium]|nr:glycosyl hydrolase [Blastocatellia bacterium]
MMSMRNTLRRLVVAALLVNPANLALAQTPSVGRQAPADALEAGFKNPPASARPRVWWHWMNGNITKDGIQKDLEWMKRAGLGGFQNFDANLFTPKVVEKKLVYMTPEWKDAFRFTTELADKLGLEMAIAGSPGWSESGGPWVPAKDGMKKYVWSETRVKGGQMFVAKLAPPPDVSGPLQNVPFGDAVFGGESKKPTFYEDAAVVAYRQPEADVSFSDLNPKITASGGQFDIKMLTDGDLARTSLLPPTAIGEHAWIQFEFDTPQTFKALTIVAGEPAAQFTTPVSNRTLQASDDGVNFREVAQIPTTTVPQNTITFAPATAKFFRVTFKTLRPEGNKWVPAFGFPQGELKPKGTDIAEIVLHTATRINRLEEKVAFTPSGELEKFVTPDTSAAIPPGDVIDLTSRMKADGKLEWNAPAGNWVVLRMGYSLTGRTNHPASPEATGLEVDKLDPQAVKAYFENYLGQYKDATGGLMGKRGLQYVITDSFEAGGANWTKNLPAEFARRRGYDMKPWLPVLTGHIVKSTEASEQFLWDFRKTLADLIAENHYDLLGELLHQRGMGRYSESHESGRAFIGDGMEVKRKADIPMSAMWTPNPFTGGGSGIEVATNYKMDVRESASVAHIYGQNLVAAESLTAIGSSFAYSPERLKPTADMELACGLNRFVIHTSVHQPLDDKQPGLSLGPFGQWFTRHETWSEQAKAWTDYLARSAYLLQQGKFASDIAYFYGEDNNITSLFYSKAPDIPAGYNYDFVNADALINVLSVKNGKLVTPSGMSYEVLVLDDNAKRMSLPVLRKIRDLVKAGATVAGIKPERVASLSDDQAEFAALVKEVWGANNRNVSAGQPLAEVLQAKNIAPDFTYSKPQADTEMLYVHRRLGEGEIYWINNRKDRVEEIEASFRVTGKAPEFWYPETGKTAPASYAIAGGRTTIRLRLDPYEAVFVVFRQPATAPSRTLPRPMETAIAQLDGAWEVSFQAGRGAPAKITLDKLTSWSDNADPGVKYFSGTAGYTQTVNAPAEWFTRGAQLWLDLGDVQNLAEVAVNGQSLGVVWKKPFRVDVTAALRPGANTVEVKVTNLWVNRLIGDQQPGVTRKYTYTALPFYRADSPLLPSGLLGPVRLVRLATE